MRPTYTKFIIIIFLLQVVLIPILSGRAIMYITIGNTLLLIVIASLGMTEKVKAIHLALLGFGVMLFFDIFKYNAIEGKELTYSHTVTIYWTYISFFIFIFTYSFFKVSKKLIIKNKNKKISKFKLMYLIVPIAFIIAVYLWLDDSSSGSVSLLLSFFPKATVILLFYMYLRTKSVVFLFFSIILFYLSFSEISRRIYITLFMILIPLVMSFYYSKYGKIRFQYKVVLVSIFMISFIFMNYLRSDYDYGDGYIEGNKLQSTINYIGEFKAIDTFDNTAFVIDEFPKTWDYYYGETYLALFVQFIPRSIWRDKIVSFGAPLGLLRKAGVREFDNELWKTSINSHSYSPGFIGEAYANFGYFGIVLMSFIFGYFTKLFDTICQIEDVVNNISMIPYLAFYSSFFLVLRGDLVMATYFSILFFLFLKLVISISSFRQNKIN